MPLWPFEPLFGTDYYAARRGEQGAPERLGRRLAELDARLRARTDLGGEEYGVADIAWFPWSPRAEALLGIDLGAYAALGVWLARLAERPAIAAQLAVVGALTR